MRALERAAGIVVTYTPPGARSATEHEQATRADLATRLAAIKGFEFGGDFQPCRTYGAPLYFVPSETLTLALAVPLGIRSVDDLFGGVVPFDVVGTKAIAHPLVAPNAYAPQGWSQGFADRVRDIVLPGFTAFTSGDARKAAVQLLAEGPVRLKAVHGVGGQEQVVVNGQGELDAALDALNAAGLVDAGIVIEPNLEEVTTYSVGQVHVGEIVASYCGTQRTTTDNLGRDVFGGSDLVVVRGTFSELDALALAPQARVAIAEARRFDAATESFDGMFASRRNYDTVHGRMSDGRWCSGVLEQSWRIGGASGAEVAALAEFQREPGLRAVRASCYEAYGEAAAPSGAIISFQGIDERVGAIVKYSTVEPYELA